MESEAPSSVDYDGGDDYQPNESIAEERRERPGLGTRFGEQRQSSVSRKRFERASRMPFAQVALHYNNLEGIQQQSWYRGTSLEELRAQTSRGGISISLTDESGRLLRGGTGAGRTYVVGQDGQRYTMHIRNDTGGTYEMVSSVDGLDVVDGKPANFSKRGYILSPYSTRRWPRCRRWQAGEFQQAWLHTFALQHSGHRRFSNEPGYRGRISLWSGE
jgi:hypothetical protein